MARLKRWYDPNAGAALRVISHVEEEETWSARKWRHPRVPPGIFECLIYPLRDGPGLGLLVLLPPMLWVLSLPIFDVIAVLQPMTKADWALGLLVVPIMVPMLFSFAMTFGYALLFLGRVLVASALGENDHPRWPEWQPADISEGIVRWFWAALFGGAIAGAPLFFFWKEWKARGAIEGWGWVLLFNLLVVALGYAQMALAAALLHDNMLAANPVTVVLAIARIGWDYVRASLLAAVAVVATGWCIWGLIYHVPTIWIEGVGIWAFWVFAFYEAMVVVRMVGLTYYAHAPDLRWFQRRPRWASGRGQGRIYVNS